MADVKVTKERVVEDIYTLKGTGVEVVVQHYITGEGCTVRCTANSKGWSRAGRVEKILQELPNHWGRGSHGDFTYFMKSFSPAFLRVLKTACE